MNELKGPAPLIQVFDMELSLRFYCDGLGFTVTDKAPADEPDWVMLKLGENILMLNTAYEKETRPAKMDEHRIKTHSDLTFYFTCNDINTAHKNLLTKNINASNPFKTVYGWDAIAIKDPDGYIVCIHCPPGEQLQQVN